MTLDEYFRSQEAVDILTSQLFDGTESRLTKRNYRHVISRGICQIITKWKEEYGDEDYY